MQLKPFEAGTYDDDLICVSNPTNGKQDLFSEREYAIVKFLKQNEKQSLLALLLPNIGIAKKSHIEMCLRVLGKLKRMQIVDYFAITGRKPASDTITTDIAGLKAKIEFPSLNALAATICGVSAKALSRLGPAGLLGLTVAAAAISFAFFPFDAVEAALQRSATSYAGLLVLAYFSGCFALSLRTLVQGAFLSSLGREALDPVVAVAPPFVALATDTRSVSLLGFRARAQMAILGIAAPFLLALLFTLLVLAHALGPVIGFTGFSAAAGVSLMLLCPVLSFDGAALIQTLFFRDELEEQVSTRLRGLFRTRGSLEREFVFTILLAVVWLFVWLDCLRALQETFGQRIALDLADGSVAEKGGAFLAIAALVVLAVFPVLIYVLQFVRDRTSLGRKRVLVHKDRVNDSLTFEERISALEKIPLFTYLNDQERLALQNEMEPMFFKHGDFLMHQGEVGREFYVLVKGQALAQHTDLKGKTSVLVEFEAGDAFGEIALIDDVPRTLSVVSEGGCIALVLRKEGFDRFSQSLGSPDRVKALVRLTSFFRRHPLFSKLGARDQAQLIDNFRFDTITAGEQIPDGDDNFHVIYSGSVRVDTGGAEGETDLQSDDCFGYSNPLRARFVALEGTGLLSVPKAAFHELIWEKLVSRPELFF